MHPIIVAARVASRGSSRAYTTHAALATLANFWSSLKHKLLMSSTRSLILRRFVAKLSLRLQRRSHRLAFLELREVMEDP
jgi:hypothetical protein